MEFYQKINRITDILRRDDGISGAMHYTEQISWLIFLKFIDDFERRMETKSSLNGTQYQTIIEKEYRWRAWANGNIGEETLMDFVNNRLFPYLRSFKDMHGGHPTRCKIADVFQSITNRISSGRTLREVVYIIDSFDFVGQFSQLSHIYEYLLCDIGSDGSGSGEFYTPRQITEILVQAIQPGLGQTIYDPAAGSGGFLIEAFEYEKNHHPDPLSDDQWKFLQEKTVFGREKIPLAYAIGMMNMILHGIESPNLYNRNSLTISSDRSEVKEHFDIIFANPPFGGKEKEPIQDLFPIKSSAAIVLFLQHIMDCLKPDGSAVVVVPEEFMFQANSAYRAVKKKLLSEFNLHTILSLPPGAFLPHTGVKANVLFFDRKGTTSKIWYYECIPPYRLTKNRLIKYEHFAEFVGLFRKRTDTEYSWTVPVTGIKDTDLSARNPGKINIRKYDSPKIILNKIRKDEDLLNQLLYEVDALVKPFKSTLTDELPEGWEMRPISSIANTTSGGTPDRANNEFWKNGSIPWIKSGELNDNACISNCEEYITELALKNSRAKLFPKGTLLIALYGATAGKLGILNIEASTNQAVCSIQQIGSEKLFEEKYLFYFLLTKREEILKDSTGVAQQNISKKYLDAIQVPLPKNLSDQQYIVVVLDEIFSRLDRIVAEKETKLRQLNELKESVLDKVFRGELH